MEIRVKQKKTRTCVTNVTFSDSNVNNAHAFTYIRWNRITSTTLRGGGVQIRNLRPETPWIERVESQIGAIVKYEN
jgi:YD repeat-containing protein